MPRPVMLQEAEVEWFYEDLQDLELTPKKDVKGNWPHLAGRGKSHGFSRVAAGTWGIFSSYSGDVHSKL